MHLPKTIDALTLYIEQHKVYEHTSVGADIEIAQEVAPSFLQLKSRKSVSKMPPIHTKKDMDQFSMLQAKSASKPAPMSPEPSVSDYIRTNMHAPFQDMLFKLVDERHMTDPQVYKQAHLDRKLFSKIRSSSDYRPSKPTVLSLALALKLSTRNAEKLLATTGYALSYSDTSDLIIRFCLEQEIYNIMDVNRLLYEFHEKSL